MKRYVYAFHEGDRDMKALLGGKGSNLAEMTRIGLPVPGGFTVTTEACIEYYEKGNKIWPELERQIQEKLAETEREAEKSWDALKHHFWFLLDQGLQFQCPA